MTRNALGEFEHLILLAVIRLGSNAYGANIIEEVEARTGRDISQAAAYIALKRLDEKGLLRSRMGPGTAERGDRAKRFFRVTAEGKVRLRDSAHALFSMWAGLDPALRSRKP
jgi:DNA-binding PadR family transcriptional regulator